MTERDNKGQFLKGNQAARKPQKCPYCDKQLLVVVYTQIAKKIKSSRLKTD